MSDDDARREIAECVEIARGNMVRAAHAIGISRSHLYRKLHQLGWEAADRIRKAEWDAHLAARRRLGVGSQDGRDDEPGM